jgi:TPR repeat protein
MQTIKLSPSKLPNPDSNPVQGNADLLFKISKDNEQQSLRDALMHINKSDYSAAIKIYVDLADKGCIQALKEVSESLKQESFAKAMLDFCTEQGRENSPGAMYILGRMYDQGRGVARDDKEAVRYYQLSADQGNAKAQNNLGFMYEQGHGVDRDDKEAVRYFQLSADQGNAVAQCNLGCMYEQGHGVDWDDKEAVRYYQLSADQGNAKAQNSLGRMYERGRGITRDDKEAVRYYQLSADQGNADAQNNLGRMYELGCGVKKSYTNAIRYYTAAYNNVNGNSFVKATAAFMLGELIINRSWTPLSEEEKDQVIDWYGKAHDAGHVEAAYKLSQHYRKRSFFPNKEDFKLAESWLNKAVKKSYPDALVEKLRQDIEAEKEKLSQDKEAEKKKKKPEPQGVVNWNFLSTPPTPKVQDIIRNKDL